MEVGQRGRRSPREYTLNDGMIELKTFIIAEAGVNHNGREDLAIALIDAAADCGADAVKFQTFSADQLVRPGAATADYQKRQTGQTDQHAMLKALELSSDMHVTLADHCAARGIEFMSTPFSEQAANFLAGLGMRRFKIPSGEITNEPFLAHLARFDRPLILSTGMADMFEIKRAITVIRSARAEAGIGELCEKDLTILHCTSNYPAHERDVNLLAMNSIAAETGLPVGYSDHTLGTAVASAAVARGATVIEKHFTLDRSLPGPDHAASLTINELAEMVRQIRSIETALGSAEKRPTDAELPVRSLVRRSITAIRSIERGEKISMADVAMMRPGDGIPPGELNAVLGRRARHAIECGATLKWMDLM